MTLKLKIINGVILKHRLRGFGIINTRTFFTKHPKRKHNMLALSFF